jgi:hypothetical protein
MRGRARCDILNRGRYITGAMIEPTQPPPAIPGSPTDKPPFVASQRLLLLNAAVDNPHRYLKPALFRPGGDRHNDDPDDDTAAATKPPRPR